MWTLAAWISVGFVTLLMGGACANPDLDDPVLNLIGYVLLALGAIVTQVGVIGLGVLVGMRARDGQSA